MDLHVGQLVRVESLVLRLAHSAELELFGTLASATAHKTLNAIFLALHGRMVERKAPAFTVDVRSLSFVNSSAIRVFVDWIARAESASYKLIFVTDPGVTWHRLSFSVLRSLAPSTVEIIERKPGQFAGHPS